MYLAHISGEHTMENSVQFSLHIILSWVAVLLIGVLVIAVLVRIARQRGRKLEAEKINMKDIL